jgi:RNA ligase (TIGR02306 family)
MRCRVAACRLRGVPSYGFVAALGDLPADTVDPMHSTSYLMFKGDPKEGDTVDQYFGAVKYEPPAVREPGLPRPKGFNGDAAPDNPAFHKYTDIQNYYKYARAIADGTPVRITEKLHGSNIRLGLIRTDDGDFAFMAGSRQVNWKPTDRNGNIPLWWRMMTEEIVNLLTDLCNEQHSVVVFGEVIGPGVQDMDYGVDEECDVRVFDISVDGRYLDWGDLFMACQKHGVEMVPCLYIGPFSKAVLDEHTNGPTTMADPAKLRSKFKGREGVVITPIYELKSRYLGGRLILKSVSADYHDRRGAVDLA